MEVDNSSITGLGRVARQSPTCLEWPHLRFAGIHALAPIRESQAFVGFGKSGVVLNQFPADFAGAIIFAISGVCTAKGRRNNQASLVRGFVASMNIHESPLTSVTTDARVSAAVQPRFVAT